MGKNRLNSKLCVLALTLAVAVSGCMGNEGKGRKRKTKRSMSSANVSCYPKINAVGSEAAILEAATYVKNTFPEFFPDLPEGDRCAANEMMRIVINTLRANGHDARRTIAHASRSDCYRWGSDALVYIDSVYDVYLSWPSPGKPHILKHGFQAGEVTSNLIALNTNRCGGPGTTPTTTTTRPVASTTTTQPQSTTTTTVPPVVVEQNAYTANIDIVEINALPVEEGEGAFYKASVRVTNNSSLAWHMGSRSSSLFHDVDIRYNCDNNHMAIDDFNNFVASGSSIDLQIIFSSAQCPAGKKLGAYIYSRNKSRTGYGGVEKSVPAAATVENTPEPQAGSVDSQVMGYSHDHGQVLQGDLTSGHVDWKNTGTEAWNTSNFEMKCFSTQGSNLTFLDNDRINLAPGASATIVVRMRGGFQSGGGCGELRHVTYQCQMFKNGAAFGQRTPDLVFQIENKCENTEPVNTDPIEG